VEGVRSDESLRKVTLHVRWEDGHLWGQVQEMPGCFAAGQSFLELLEALQEAIGQWLSDSDHPLNVQILDVRGEQILDVRGELQSIPERTEWYRELAICV
jgi:predicted RNase H-like HicB family nuclease